MKLLIDVQGCQSRGSAQRGIGRYVRSLVNALLQAAPQHEIHLLANGALGGAQLLRAEAFPGIPPERMAEFHAPAGCAVEAQQPARTGAALALRAWAIRQLAPDVVLVASPFEGLTDDAAVDLQAVPPARTAAVVFDIIPALYPEVYLAGAVTREWYQSRLAELRGADLLLTISDSVRGEVCQAWPELAGRTVNISSAAEAPHLPGDSPMATLPQVLQGRDFILYTGGMDWRKNIDRLIEAYGLLPAELRRRFGLAIVCAAEPRHLQKLGAVRKRAGLAEHEVVFTGYVPDAQLEALYRRCSLFVFPSLHEGFGLPVLEAMWRGAAVIGSRSSSIPEVIGMDEALFDPKDVSAMARAMERGLTDAGFAAALKANALVQRERFSWRRTAASALAALERLAAEEPRRGAPVSVPDRAAVPAPAQGKPRLAFFSPIPPTPSGIADYTADLIVELDAHYEIVLCCEQAMRSLRVGPREFEVRDHAWFRGHWREFDRRVYQFGNSRFHAELFELARDYPGVVVLHDFMVGGAVQWAEEVLGRQGFFLQSLLASHGREAVDVMAREGRLEAIARYPMNRQLLLHASGVIVHSRHAMAEAERWYGAGTTEGWHLVAQPRRVPARTISREETRRRLGLPPDALLVCSFGHISESKLAHRLVAAFAASAAGAKPQARLVLVGEVAGSLCGMQLREAIGRLRDPAQVSVTGFAAEADYETYLQAADLAVQLRTQSRGETSRAILDCLAHGVPLVINTSGANTEYPGEVVARVPEDFSDAELARELDALASDRQRRDRLGAAGADWFLRHHQPAQAARSYAEAIEAALARPLHQPRRELLQSLAAGAQDAGEADLLAIADSAARTLAAGGALKPPAAAPASAPTVP